MNILTNSVISCLKEIRYKAREEMDLKFLA